MTFGIADVSITVGMASLKSVRSIAGLTVKVNREYYLSPIPLPLGDIG